MAKRTLHLYNDPVLRRKARPVKQISGIVRKLVADLFETMYENSGIGLAAPQVGVSKRIFVVDTKTVGEKLAVINPKIIASSKDDQESEEEGCLSLPDIKADIIRSQKVTLQYTTLEGEEIRVEAEKLLARVIQHEFDHLEGILFIDRVESAGKRKKLIQKMNDLEAAL